MCALLRHEVLVAASNERGISCHPSRICSALDHPPCCSGSYVTKLLHLEPHPPRGNFIIVRALFKSGVMFA